MATIDDLPDDVLVSIFKLLMDGCWGLPGSSAPSGVHLTLRSTCRRWTPLADWARLDGYKVKLKAYELDDAATVRARQPTAIKKLVARGLDDDYFSWHDPKPVEHTLALPHALESLARDPDLRRSLRQLDVRSACCPAALFDALPAVASFTALTKLGLSWVCHTGQVYKKSYSLAPLSQLVRLERLVLRFGGDRLLKDRWRIQKWPTLPDVPRLTSLKLLSGNLFIPVGSDAALGRIRRLKLDRTRFSRHLETTDDYFGLRAALDEGTWRPHIWTGLRELQVTLSYHTGVKRSTIPPIEHAPGAEWLPLADQITKLVVMTPPRLRSSPVPPTGLIAGLGVLTALRELQVVFPKSYEDDGDVQLPHPVDWTRVHAPRLTSLKTYYAATPLDASPFPRLEEVRVYPEMASPRHSCVVLSSLAGRSRLRVLVMESFRAYVNLAELFVGGVGLPALEELSVTNGRPVWDASEVAGAPDADEFAHNVHALLPSLKRVEVDELSGDDWWSDDYSSEGDFDLEVDFDTDFGYEYDEEFWRERIAARLEERRAAREEARRPLTKFRSVVRPALKRLCGADRRG